MGNFILITLLAAQPTVSPVMTKEACVQAQQRAGSERYIATCLDVGLIDRYVLLTSTGTNSTYIVQAKED